MASVQAAYAGLRVEQAVDEPSRRRGVDVHAPVGLPATSSCGGIQQAIELFIRREDTERFVEDVCGDDPELRDLLRLEPVELA
jgi:hypothetical protein